jgi:hypothetical protein
LLKDPLPPDPPDAVKRLDGFCKGPSVPEPVPPAPPGLVPPLGGAAVGADPPVALIGDVGDCDGQVALVVPAVPPTVRENVSPPVTV